MEYVLKQKKETTEKKTKHITRTHAQQTAIGRQLTANSKRFAANNKRQTTTKTMRFTSNTHHTVKT